MKAATLTAGGGVFAEEPSTSTVVTVVGMVLTGLGAAGASLFAWLSNRDRLRHDVDMKALREGMERCEKECAASKSVLSDAVQRREKAELLAARMEGELRAAERELKESHEEIEELRNRLYGKVGDR